MTKKVTAFILSLLILFSLPASAFGAGNVSVSIDGTGVAFTKATGKPFVDWPTELWFLYVLPWRIMAVRCIGTTRTTGQSYTKMA